MLRFTSVTKRYPGGTEALRGIDLEVPAGQFCALLGPSGSGKSTLLRTVNGLVEPSLGAVDVDGERVEKRGLAAIRQVVGMVHQDFRLVPRLSVLDNVLCGALAVTPLWRVILRAFAPDWQSRACERLDEVGLEPGLARRQARALSGGQQQRVAIARAFLSEPRVILADEPVASLDPRTSDEILGLLRRAASDRGTTVFCSLHQVGLARRFADRIVALKGGAIAFDGSPAEFDDRAAVAIYGTADLDGGNA